jgi:hypothetical protein
LTPENAGLLARYADHLERSPLTGYSPRTYLGAVRAYIGHATVDGFVRSSAAVVKNLQPL